MLIVATHLMDPRLQPSLPQFPMAARKPLDNRLKHHRDITITNRITITDLIIILITLIDVVVAILAGGPSSPHSPRCNRLTSSSQLQNRYTESPSEHPDTIITNTIITNTNTTITITIITTTKTSTHLKHPQHLNTSPSSQAHRARRRPLQQFFTPNPHAASPS